MQSFEIRASSQCGAVSVNFRLREPSIGAASKQASKKVKISRNVVELPRFLSLGLLDYLDVKLWAQAQRVFECTGRRGVKIRDKISFRFLDPSHSLGDEVGSFARFLQLFVIVSRAVYVFSNNVVKELS